MTPSQTGVCHYFANRQLCDSFLFYEVPIEKKRGAPIGNKNAQKHGFYSRAYTQNEQQELSQIRVHYRQNNIKFCKVRIARIAERIKPSALNPMSFQENLLALRTVIIALLRLYSWVNLKHQTLNGKEIDTEKEMIEFCQRFGMTQKEIDQELYGIIPVRRAEKKRGGQTGNLNALKHGFYASHYTLEELRKLEDMNEDDVIEEIALLQILMKRIFIGMKDDIPLLDYLRADQVLSYADACLEKLNRIRSFMFNPEAIIEEAFEMARTELGIND